MTQRAFAEMRGAADGRDHIACRFRALVGCGGYGIGILAIDCRVRGRSPGIEHCLLSGFRLARLDDAVAHRSNDGPQLAARHRCARTPGLAGAQKRGRVERSGEGTEKDFQIPGRKRPDRILGREQECRGGIEEDLPARSGVGAARFGGIRSRPDVDLVARPGAGHDAPAVAEEGRVDDLDGK